MISIKRRKTIDTCWEKGKENHGKCWQWIIIHDVICVIRYAVLTTLYSALMKTAWQLTAICVSGRTMYSFFIIKNIEKINWVLPFGKWSRHI